MSISLPLGQLSDLRKGKKANIIYNESMGRALPYLQIDEVRGFPSDSFTDDQKGVDVSQKDICIVWDGANAGTVGFGIQGIIGSTVSRIRLKQPKKWHTPFIGRLLQAQFSLLNETAKGKGATIPHVNKDVLNGMQIPILDLDEQKRITGILDKADAIRRKRAASLKLLDELLRATFLDMFGDPITNPKSWPMRQLADVVRADSIVTYGIVQAGPNYPGGVPYIRTGDIKYSKILDNQLMRTDPEIASKFKRSEVHAGDLVMSIRATVGTIAMVPASLSGANLTQGTAKISPGSDVDGRFLFSYINSEGCQNWIQRHVKGATFREITLSKLREMPVYVPDKTSQRKFREIADQYERTKNDYTHFVKESDKLFHALVARAFKGEL